MSRLRPHPSVLLFACLALAAIVVAGCGGGGGETRPAPSAAEFPQPKGESLNQLLENSGAKETKLVIAPAARDFVQGENRFPFGVFTAGGEQVENADVALYFAKSANTKEVVGPLPARLETLETKPAYRAETSGAKGDAQSVYVVPKVDFDKDGPWVAVAMLKGENGLEASLVPDTSVGAFPKIPDVGQRPPKITTLTAADVGGDLAKIDTRIPPDQMHKYDFKEILGKKPIVLVIATPALCQSRVCGPVVDVAQQVADEYEPEVAFIHQEVYVNNEPPEIRPQLKAFGLETEPWTFLIGKEGIIKDRIEGAYGVRELEAAMKTIAPG